MTREFNEHGPSDRGRRLFLQAAGGGTLAAAVAASSYVALTRRPEPAIQSTGQEGDDSAGQAAPETEGDDASEPVATAATDDGVDDLPIVEWEMPTSWPESLPVLWGNAQLFAQRVAELTGNRFRITPAPAGELSSPVEVLNVVSAGDFSAGSTASYYYIADTPALAFATAVPFGLTMRQHVSWLYYGGGLDLMQDIFARNFNLIQFPAGNTGAQMGGWFREEIQSLDDLQGLRMRVPGLGGQVMERLGVEVVVLGPPDIPGALSSGEVDAAEFIGPYDDSRLGLQETAPFYYSPGFWEPAASLDFMVNLDRWNELPPLYQTAFRTATFESMVRVTAEYDARNGQALNELVLAGTELRQFPDDVLQAAEAATGIILDELAVADEDFAEVLEQWRGFRRQVTPWFSLAEAGSLQ